MKTIKIDKNHSTFAPEVKDLRPFEQAWREDFPNSKPAEKPENGQWPEWNAA